MAANLYVHFPFCRSRCSYCALYSRAGSTPASRSDYVARLAGALDKAADRFGAKPLSTVYFGGGSPALCDLRPLAPTLRRLCGEETEFTVELHPLDVCADKLEELGSIGVNRISMGVQSLDDRVLAHMGRGYGADDAARAFELVKARFDNAGIDLIVGYPGDGGTDISSLGGWGLSHCSVYSLQNERGLRDVPDDDSVLDRIHAVAGFLKTIGLERYEISNYALPGRECRHNLAVWRGEDYYGIGEGAYGRAGLFRTRSWWGEPLEESASVERVDEAGDDKERTLFRLRTREGLDASRHPEWLPVLDGFVGQGLLRKQSGPVYLLTERGTEVCDSILADLV